VSYSAAIDFGPSKRHLPALATRPDWDFEGAQAAQVTLLHSSGDGAVTTYLWDCTPGRLSFSCPREWTIYVAHGALVVRDEHGFHNHLSTGSSVLFPAGSHAHWVLEQHARLVVFCRDPLPRLYRLSGWLYRQLHKVAGLRRESTSGIARPQ
jgi:uncharacterized cupin superfamily protein